MFFKGKEFHRKGISFLLAVVLVISAVFVCDFLTSAATYKKGTVVGVTTTLNFRKEPVNGTVVASLTNGQSGEILEEKKASDGYTWYKMEVNGIIGWARSDYIKVEVITLDTDDEFEAYLTKQGFPESYKESLRKLHDKYPNWVFEAQHVGLTWDEVIAAENEFGRSLISKSSISSWKSIENGAYNWTTGEWVGLDGGSWTAASKEIIEYYVDPRNFLDEIYIFQFLKQSYDSTIDYAPGLTTLFSKSTFWSTPFEENGVQKTYVQTLVEVGKAEGVSPFTIASTLIQEKGWNPSGIMVDGSRGVYNYYNAGAFEGQVDGVHMSPAERGVWYAKQTDAGTLRPWTTRTLAIQGGTKNYAKNYIGVGQDTIYLKKFDVVAQGGLYWHQYMTNIQAAASEGKLLADAFWTAEASEWTKSSSLKFKIPVYTKMPEKASPKPTGTGSPNYMLKSLEVEGYSITPTFSMYDTAYELIVPHNIGKVKVSATAYAKDAAITVSGADKLAVGTNTIDVKVTAPNGNVRTYTIKIVRQTPPADIKEPSVTSSNYSLNHESKVITGLKGSTSVADFLKGLTIANGTAKVVNADGSARTGFVGTGNKVQVYDSASQLKKTYEVILYGDADGDGQIYTKDYMIIKKTILGQYKLEGSHYQAADTSRKNGIDTLDYMQVKKQILGQFTISQ